LVVGLLMRNAPGVSKTISHQNRHRIIGEA